MRAIGKQNRLHISILCRRRNKNLKEKRKGVSQVKSKEWINNKKERREKQGKKTVGPSAYTGRNRGPKF